MVGISELALITKIDNLHEKIEQDLTMAFHSVVMQKRIKEIAEFLEFPVNQVLMARNYHSEKEKDVKINILALWNMKQILNACDSTLDSYITKGTCGHVFSILRHSYKGKPILDTNCYADVFFLLSL